MAIRHRGSLVELGDGCLRARHQWSGTLGVISKVSKSKRASTLAFSPLFRIVIGTCSLAAARRCDAWDRYRRRLGVMSTTTTILYCHRSEPGKPGAQDFTEKICNTSISFYRCGFFHETCTYSILYNARFNCIFFLFFSFLFLFFLHL